MIQLEVPVRKRRGALCRLSATIRARSETSVDAKGGALVVQVRGPYFDSAAQDPSSLRRREEAERNNFAAREGIHGREITGNNLASEDRASLPDTVSALVFHGFHQCDVK